MSRSRVVVSILIVLVSIVVQTTVFAPGRIQPLGVGPALVTLVVIAVSPHLEAEYLILIGFTAGILMDLMGSGTLGLWAMTLTAVAYASSRLRGRFVDGPVYIGGIVVGLTIAGQLLFVLLGTLFGQGTIAVQGVFWKIVLPGLWNLVLAFPVFWIVGKLSKTRQSGWAV